MTSPHIEPRFEDCPLGKPELFLILGEQSSTSEAPQLPSHETIIGRLIVAQLGDRQWDIPDDEDIHVRKESFISVGGREANPDQQLRAVWNAVARVDTNAIVNPEGWYAPQSLKWINAYLFSKAPSKDNGYVRAELLPPKDVTTILSIIMRAQNDPVIRVLDKVEKDVVGEEYSLSEFRRLKGDALLATKRPIIRETYHNYINELRAWVKALPN